MKGGKLLTYIAVVYSGKMFGITRSLSALTNIFVLFEEKCRQLTLAEQSKDENESAKVFFLFYK